MLHFDFKIIIPLISLNILVTLQRCMSLKRSLLLQNDMTYIILYIYNMYSSTLCMYNMLFLDRPTN